jgi:hypothetical protein
MPLKRKTPEEKEQARLEREQHRQAEQLRKQWEAFYATPQGQARLAFERGDHVFQYEIDVMNQQAIIVAMVGSTTSHKRVDPTWVLNSVCREGWKLVNGSFVFVEQGQQSRDKFMSSGQNVAVKGKTVGYYLFKRCPENRQVDGNVAVDADGLSLDNAQMLYESGEILAAADIMRQLADQAQEAGDRQEIEGVEDTIRQMRSHLTGQELVEFDSILRFGPG